LNLPSGFHGFLSVLALLQLILTARFGLVLHIFHHAVIPAPLLLFIRVHLSIPYETLLH